MRHVALLLLLAALPLPALAAPGEGLEAVGFLVGEHAGKGKHPYGAYDETQVGTRGVGGTVIEVRTKSTMGERTVHEDLRVFSFDAEAKALRMRQWAKGLLRVYTGTAEDDGRVVFEETSREGPSKERWRYTFKPKEGGGFRYVLDVDRGGGWKPFVSGELGREMKDPGKGGGLGMREYETAIGGMAAQVHHPDGEGPFPAIVFSPGGNASTVQGYRPYGRWYATWGYVTVIVAFDDASAKERAPKFAAVLDWLEKENARDGAPLEGLVDVGRLAVAGHSRGGHAALLAARADARVDACLALAPSGPEEPAEGAQASATCLIIGDEDRFLSAARKAHEHARGESFLLVVPGLDHMLQPREQVLELVARSTSFLEYALKGDARYRAPLTAAARGVEVSARGR